MTGYPRPGSGAPRADILAGWRDEAACAGKHHLFFGPEAEKPAAMRLREMAAKRICASCPVKDPCLEYAELLPADLRYAGVYGGLGEEDRESLRRRRAQLARLEREGVAS